MNSPVTRSYRAASHGFFSHETYFNTARSIHSYCIGATKVAIATLTQFAIALKIYVERSFLFVGKYYGAKDYSAVSRVAYAIMSSSYKALGLSSPMLAMGCEGYERSPKRILTQDETRALLPYACVCAASHSPNKPWTAPFKISPHAFAEYLDEATFEKLKSLGFTLYKDALINWDQAIKLSLFKDDKGKLILSFGDANANTVLYNQALESKAVSPQMKPSDAIARHMVIKSYLGAHVEVFENLCKVMDIIKPKFAEASLCLAGQCWGGTLASYVGIKMKISTICINSPALGVDLQQALGQDLHKAKEWVTHVFTKGDWTQSDPLVGFVDWTLSRFGLRTPGSFGRKFEIPSAYTSYQATHIFFLGSVMHHLGFDKRTCPHDVKEHSQEFINLMPPENVNIFNI